MPKLPGRVPATRVVRPRAFALRLFVAGTLTASAACTVDDVVLDDEPGDTDPLDTGDTADTAPSDADATEVGSDTDPDGNDADASADPCDLSGTWAVKGSFIALDDLFSSSQLSNNWYYLEIEDRGEEVEIVGGWDCGIRVEGAASVTITAATTEALRQRNSQIGRTGRFFLDGDTCHLEFERWFWVRGGDAALLPDDFEAYHDDDALERLDEEKPMPTPDNPDQAEDTEGDGELGMAYQVGGAVAGTRHVVQRDWNEYFSSDDYPIAPGSDDFTADALFDVSETMMAITGCEGGFGCGILEAGSTANPNGDHRIRFVRVNPDDVLGETDLDTCFNVQDLIEWERP